MFRFTFDVDVMIEGCPDAGLPAVKFREENGLPPEPTSVFRVRFDLESRELAERFANYLDEHADFSAVSYSTEVRHMPVPPALLQAEARQDLVALLVEETGRRREAYLARRIAETMEKPTTYFIMENYGEPRIADVLELNHPQCSAKLAEVKALLATLLDKLEAERAQNRAESAQREERKKAAEAEQARIDAAFETALWAWIESDGTESQRSRRARNLLSVDEARAALADNLFAPMAGWGRYERMTAKDVCDCEYENCKVEFETVEGDGVTLNEEQFDSLVAIENLMPKDVKVSPRLHIGTSEDCDNRVERCGYSVTATWNGKSFTREYMS